MVRAIKLVDVLPDGRLEVTAEGMEFLHTIEEPIGVVAVVGPTHVGKSFMANILVQT
jgi:polynucleotide 5'-kinase involved in rRNA processing